MGGDPYIRVDHPSDLVDVGCLSQAQLIRTVLSDIRASLLALHGATPLEWKEEGNSALTDGDLQCSLDCFTKGLQYFLDIHESESSDVKKDLLRNRSFVRLKLGQYEGAVTDAIASLCNQTLDKRKDAKSYFCAGQASYALGDYEEAATYLRKLLDLESDHPDAAQLLSKTGARLREQASGVYDLAAIKNSISERSRGLMPRTSSATLR